MSRVLPNPITVGYPVKFESGGDKTNDAFHKHIQEIKRIYGYLQSLDEGKVSADEVSGSLNGINSSLQSHINSTNPHPNWKPSFSFNDITGTLDASKVVGKLTNATIDASKVDGLASAITAHIPASSGITNGTVSDNGYVKFGNGLMIVWGSVLVCNSSSSNVWSKFRQEINAPENKYHAITNINIVLLNPKFSEACYSLSANVIAPKEIEFSVVGGTSKGQYIFTPYIHDVNKNSFSFEVQAESMGYEPLSELNYMASGEIRLHYIAIGK